MSNKQQIIFVEFIVIIGRIKYHLANIPIMKKVCYNTCALKSPHQFEHVHNLVAVFDVQMKKARILVYFLKAQTSTRIRLIYIYLHLFDFIDFLLILRMYEP